MKRQVFILNHPFKQKRVVFLIASAMALLWMCVLLPSAARAGTAYGSINNFDAVNDTGVECHGFEIELDDIQSVDITYTYDWNHYGTPKIIEDGSSVPGHTNVFIRYEAVWTNTGWSAYTVIPSGPILPTDGHQFTNPSTNFGGEHFGAGFFRQPSAVKYHWLVDDGSHQLTLGPALTLSTPSFTYNPPGGGAPAQVQAAIIAPAAPILMEFGDATWVKEIRTSSHNNNEVKLRNLVSADPDDPQREDWRNGEPDEVEVEWQIMQIDTGAADGLGKNGELAAAPENLNQGDEVVTRRYEFYEYEGPYDPETHEVKTEKVGPDGIHGVGEYANTVVVGKFIGAQMAAVAVGAPLGLIDHLPDGEVNSDYPTRSLVIAGDTNFTVTTEGTLPAGLAFDFITGRIAGMPLTSGVFVFTVSASSSNGPASTKHYPFLITEAGELPPPHSSVDITVVPSGAGTADGTGVYTNGTLTTAVAKPSPGFVFSNWTENGQVMSTSPSYTFTNFINQSLLANFAVSPNPRIELRTVTAQSFLITWGTNYQGFVLQENGIAGGVGWGTVKNPVSLVGSEYQVTIQTTNSPRFFRLFR